MRLEPDNVFWRTYLGLYSRGKKKYSEDEAEYRRAAELDPNNATRYGGCGDRLVEQLKYNEAEIEYRRSCGSNRTMPDGETTGIRAYQTAEMGRRADRVQRAVRIDPSEPRYPGIIERSKQQSVEKPAKTTTTGSQPAAKTEPAADTPVRKYIQNGDSGQRQEVGRGRRAYKQAAQFDKNNAVRTQSWR